MILATVVFYFAQRRVPIKFTTGTRSIIRECHFVRDDPRERLEARNYPELSLSVVELKPMYRAGKMFLAHVCSV